MRAWFLRLLFGFLAFPLFPPSVFLLVLFLYIILRD